MRRVLACLGAAIAAPVAAQMYVPPFNFTPQIAARVVTPQLEAQKQRQRQQENEPRGRGRVTAPTSPVASLVYLPSSARTRANIAAFAQRSRTVDPQGTATMEALFASGDAMGTIEGELRKVGLTRSNIADAYAVWWTNAWLATQGRTDNPPLEQLQAVKRQAAAALLASPGFATTTQAQKQEFAEAHLVQAMLIGASLEAAKEQPTLMASLKAAVAKGAKASGLDLSTMTLTPQGFRASADR